MDTELEKSEQVGTVVPAENKQLSGEISGAIRACARKIQIARSGPCRRRWPSDVDRASHWSDERSLAEVQEPMENTFGMSQPTSCGASLPHKAYVGELRERAPDPLCSGCNKTHFPRENPRHSP